MYVKCTERGFRNLCLISLWMGVNGGMGHCQGSCTQGFFRRLQFVLFYMLVVSRLSVCFSTVVKLQIR